MIIELSASALLDTDRILWQMWSALQLIPVRLIPATQLRSVLLIRQAVRSVSAHLDWLEILMERDVNRKDIVRPTETVRHIRSVLMRCVSTRAITPVETMRFARSSMENRSVGAFTSLYLRPRDWSMAVFELSMDVIVMLNVMMLSV